MVKYFFIFPKWCLTLAAVLLFCSRSENPSDAQKCYTLKVSADSCGAVIDSGVHKIAEGGVYELIAGQPSKGHRFAYWSVLIGEENVTILRKDSSHATIVNVLGNAEVKAIFTKSEYKFSYTILPAHSIDSVILYPEPKNNGLYDYGTEVKVHFVPVSSWKVSRWNRIAKANTDSAIITMVENFSDTITSNVIGVPGNVICVKWDAQQNGGGIIGSSWVDAFNNLTDALAAVNELKNVLWVAKGTYNTTSKTTPYVLPNGATLTGGFIGTETSPNTRDSLRNTTIISGVVNSTDTANTILSISATSDNVTISNVTIAYSKGLSTNPSHGGLIAAAAAKNLTVKCCLFKKNFPRALEPARNSLIQQCVFVENKGLYGAALTINTGDSTLIRNCLFYKNETSGTGAAAYVGATGCAMVNCTVAYNNSTGPESSGGISNGGGLSMANCIVWGNTVSSTAYGTQIDVTDLVAKCNIQNSATTGVAEKNTGWLISNIDVDPLFANSTTPVTNEYDYFTTNSGFRLQSGSACINNGARISGHDAWWPTVDIKGSVSPNGDYDMGAYDQ
jgi:hypothetical protein